MEITLDIESSGLLNEDSLLYPLFKLKSTYKVHCVVCQDLETKEIFKFYQDSLGELKEFLAGVTKIVGHNLIDFDLPVLKLYFDVDYEVYPDKLMGRDCVIEDTLIMSKLLNPDRTGGHSLKSWGKRLGFSKGAFGEVDDDDIDVWEEFSFDMLEYCVRDVELTTKVYYYLKKQEGFDHHKWDEAYQLEKAVREIVSRQQHVGFWFDKEKAEKHHATLERIMKEIAERVEPQLPLKPITKTEAKNFIPPVRQFKKNGEASAFLHKFATKHGGTLEVDENGAPTKLETYFGTWTDFPLPEGEPLLKETKMYLSDQKYIKQHLVELGWVPTEWGDRDLTTDSKNKKQPREKIIASIDRYIEDCKDNPFTPFRLDVFEATDLEDLRERLMGANFSRAIKVITSPKFTVGLEKEIDPALEEVDGADYGQDIADWLTYRHRKNAIKSENGTGFLNTMRKDGRINTPADTLGAVTSRFKHRNVANIPRVTSKFGAEMRELFGVDKDHLQVGCDADGLEARIEGHYTYKYDNGAEYAESLVAAKPNDIHTVNAGKMGIPRDSAKSVKYGCLPVENTEVLTKEGWKFFKELSVGDDIISFNTKKGKLEADVIGETFFYEDAEVVVKENSHYRIESTPDHRWYGWKRKTTGKGENQRRSNVWGFFQTEDMTTEHNILMAAPIDEKSGNKNLSVAEAGFLGWLLSDGYYKWSTLPEGTSCANGARKGVVCSITQSVQKYWLDLETNLVDCGFSFNRRREPKSNGNDIYSYHLKSTQIRAFFDRVVPDRKQKHEEDWAKLILTFNKAQLSAFFNSFWLADGHLERGVKVITQNEGTISDAVELAGMLLGYRVTKTDRGDGVNKKCFSLRFSERKSITNQKFVDSIEVKDVFCLSTFNETFIVRQNNAIMITGNCSYGASWPKLKKMLGVGDSEAKRIFNEFWKAAKPLTDLKERATKYWETQGNRAFILGIDGRKLLVRSPHAILNTLFQSAGVICMKRAMVIWDRAIKERGIENAEQMIAYHDETQVQILRDMADVKFFKTEEEVNKYKTEQEEATGKLYSDVGHAGQWYWCGYSEVGEMLAEAITEAGEYYNLNVTLTGGYQLGRNWGECH